MKNGVAGKSLEVIENDNVIIPVRMLVEVGEQFSHRWAFHKISGPRKAIPKDTLNLVLLLAAIKTATLLLAVEAVALVLLSLR